MRFVGAPFAGAAVDRAGERLVLASGMGIVAVSSAMAGLAQSFWQLLLLRGVGGIGSAMFTVSAAALLLRVVAPQQRARASGAFTSGFLIGGITGPLFGGLLTSVSYRLPFFVYAATLLLAGAIGLVYLSHARLQAREQQVGTDEPPTSLRQALRSSAYRAAVVNSFATGWGLFGLRMSLLPLFVVEGLDLGAEWVGYGLLVSTLAQGVLLVPAGRVSDLHGRKGSFVGGAVLVTASFVILAAWETPASYLLSMVMVGVGSAFLGTSSTAVVGDVIEGRGGRPISVYQMAGDAGAVMGPIVAGALSDSLSYAAAFAASALVSGIGVALAAVMPETLRRSHPAG
jgi:MFS family permease